MEDHEVAWGRPTIDEIRDFFTTPCHSVDPRSVMNFPESDSSVDLDESFKSLLEKRRKECQERKQPLATPVSTKKIEPGARYLPNTPLVAKLDYTEDGSMFEGNQTEFMGSEDTFIRLEEMCEDGQEEAALKRLLKAEANFSTGDLTQLTDIEAPSHMWEQSLLHVNSPKASPIKMVHLLRPSTIIEESSNAESTSVADDSLIKSKDLEQKEIEQDSLNENANDLNFTVQKTQEEDRSKNIIVENLHNTSLPCSEQASVVNIASDSSDDENIEITKKILYENDRSQSNTPEIVAVAKYESFDANTLEPNPSIKKVDGTESESDKRIDTEISEPASRTINSTTYESFATEKYNSDSTNYTYYTAESTLRPSISRKLAIDTNVFPKKKHTFFDDDIISITSSSSNLSCSVKNETIENESSFVDDKRDSSINSPIVIPNFNDTFEEMEFMMNQGMKLVEKKMSNKTEQSSKILVPKHRNSPATPRPKLNSPLRTGNYNVKSPLFGSKSTTDSASKKCTPNTFKVPFTNPRTLSTKSKKFDHIVSPIHQYIKNAPQYPLQAKGHGTSGLINQLGNRNTRETQYFGNENSSKIGEQSSYEPLIPCKGAILAPKIRVIDERTPTKIPGMGNMVTKLIGNSNPEIIKHEGRFKSAVVHREINADNTIDESLQNLSMASGDVSFQVLKNLNRV